MPELSTEAIPLSLKPFNFHGMYVKPNGVMGQATGDCIFCGREGKAYVNIESTKWDCKRCGKSGNASSFLQSLYEESVAYTTDEQYKQLANDRKLMTTEALIKWGVAFSFGREEWIQPGYFYGSDKVKNLYRYTDYLSKDGKRYLAGTPGLEQCLGGVNLYDPNRENVYICEGFWDGIALWEILRFTRMNIQSGQMEYTGSEENSLLANANIITVPGANILNEHWVKLLSDKRVFMLFDNDYPLKNDKTGKNSEPVSLSGMKRLVRKMQELDTQPKEVLYLDWRGSEHQDKSYNPLLKHGYDIRDLLSDGYTSFPSGSKQRLEEFERRAQKLNNLFDLIKPIPYEWVDSSLSGSKGKDGKLGISLLPCSEWAVLESAWRECMVWHNGLSKTLSCMLAVILSTKQKGKSQTWLKVIGQPSTGKSVLCDALCVNRKYVVPKSDIRGFYSGMRVSKEDQKKANDQKEKKEDYTLIEEIRDKTFVTKDGDTLLQSTNKEQILAQGRDLFDGNSQSHYRNGQGKEHSNHRTTWILCGTESLRALDTSELGERFLDCRILEEMTPDMERSIGIAAIRSMREAMKEEVTQKDGGMDDVATLRAKKLTGGYIDYLRKNAKELITKVNNNVSSKIDNDIYNLGLFISYMRPRPSKERTEGIQRELAARLPQQLFRLASCLAVVMNRETIDSLVMSRVYSVAMDTARGTSFDIAKWLYGEPLGLTKPVIKERFFQKEDRLTDLLNLLCQIKAIETYTERKGDLQSPERYRLTIEFRRVCNKVFEL